MAENGDIRYDIQSRKPLFVAAELDLLREYQPLLERCAKGTTQLYLTLQAYVNHQKHNPMFGYAWPSQRLLSVTCDLSERQIRYCFAVLRDLELISIERRGRMRTNLITIDALPSLEYVCDLARKFYPDSLAELEADMRDVKQVIHNESDRQIMPVTTGG